MAKTTVTIGEFILNVLSAEQFAAAVKAGEIDPNQMYLTPEKQLVVAVSEDEYEAMKAAGTLDEDVLYVTPVTEQTTIAEATETTAGLMPPSAVTKLKGIDEGREQVHSPHAYRPGQRPVQKSPWTAWGTSSLFLLCRKATSPTWAFRIPTQPTIWPPDYSNGLMSADQYTKLKGIASGANKNHGRCRTVQQQRQPGAEQSPLRCPAVGVLRHLLRGQLDDRLHG